MIRENLINKERIMPPDDQLALWVRGESVHNGVDFMHGECCPDFSCCNPGTKWPEEKRRLFSKSDDATRYKMLLGALSDLMDYTETRKVYIAGK